MIARAGARAVAHHPRRRACALAHAHQSGCARVPKHRGVAFACSGACGANRGLRPRLLLFLFWVLAPFARCAGGSPAAMHTYIDTCMYVCMHVCMYVCVCVCNVCMHVCMHVMYVCIHKCMYVCVYVCVYVYIASTERERASIIAAKGARKRRHSLRHCQKNGCWQHASRNRPKPGGCAFFASVFRHTLNSRGLGSRGGCGCGDLPAQSHARRQVAGTRHPPVFGRCARALSCPDPPEHARCAAV